MVVIKKKKVNNSLNIVHDNNSVMRKKNKETYAIQMKTLMACLLTAVLHRGDGGGDGAVFPVSLHVPARRPAQPRH